MNKNSNKSPFILIIALLSICIVEMLVIILLAFNIKDISRTRDELNDKVSSLKTKIERLENKEGADESEDDGKESEDKSKDSKDDSKDSKDESKEVKEEKPDLSIYINASAGAVIEPQYVLGYEDEYFYAKEIHEGDEIYERINGRSYYENPNVALRDLRYVRVLHYNFHHGIQIGELIVNAKVEDNVLGIFRELYDMEYEIESMYLIDDFWMGDGDSSDTESIQHNNTSSFCYRLITGGSNLSNHAYGYAIDLNPQQNPYVWYEGNVQVWHHENASPYIDRSCGDPHVIVKDDACYQVFKKYGYSWGGEWTDPIDYQHFEYLDQ